MCFIYNREIFKISLLFFNKDGFSTPLSISPKTLKAFNMNSPECQFGDKNEDNFPNSEGVKLM